MAKLLRYSLIVGITVALAPMALAADCCQQKAETDKGGGCCEAFAADHAACSHHATGGCCGSKRDGCGATQWADPASVHWAHKGVSFGNYMKLAKADVPATVVCPPAPSLGPIYFDFDKSHLRPESVEVCRQLAEYLKANPGQTVRIEGNCCDIGTKAYNKKLGARRAAAVKKFLVENGVAGKRIKTVSYGEDRAKHGPDQRELDRRDDFVIQCADTAAKK